MELYGRGHQQPGEWIPVAAGGTGLEESMLRLGLGSSETYPQRSGVPDCVFYMRTGYCGFGSRCRYNHPRDRAAVAAAVMATGNYPQRPGEPHCQYYLKTGTCKFGASCKFDHPKHEGGSLVQVPLNVHGYPLRPGEEECSYYSKTGQCKFGITCKFHHPQPDGVSPLPASAPHFYPSVQNSSVPVPEQYGGGSTNLSVARPPLYVPGTYGPVLYPPGVVPVPGWNPYSASVSPGPSPGAQPAVRGGSMYGVPNISSSTPRVGGSYPSFPSIAGPSNSSGRERVFPERPGEPECAYYMKTGDCKFGSSCKFHHPRDRAVSRTDTVLNVMGLPLRPGVQPCSFFLQKGFCKFGPTCKFDHPIRTMSYSPSASSFVDMPVTPYPVGSYLATVAPSSSSPELRPELFTGSDNGSFSTRMPPSGNMSSSSVGLIRSHTGAVSISAPLSTSRNTRQGGEVHHSS